MVNLVNELQILGIPESDIGIAFTESENSDKLPKALVTNRTALRNNLIKNRSLPSEVKIFITTTQNKEGISIEDDDIKYMFSESHNKYDLEQMAGRVRGNPETGTGLYALVVAYDAVPQPTTLSYIEKELDRALVGSVEGIMDSHRKLTEASGLEYCLSKDISSVQKNHPYLRYDRIAESFLFYEGREKCLQLDKANQDEFTKWIDLLYDHLYDEWSSSGSYCIDVTGGYELWRRWFPHSELYHSSAVGLPSSERATNELLEYLSAENYIEVPLNSDEQQAVLTKIHTLIQKYGAKELGFGPTPPYHSWACTQTILPPTRTNSQQQQQGQGHPSHFVQSGLIRGIFYVLKGKTKNPLLGGGNYLSNQHIILPLRSRLICCDEKVSPTPPYQRSQIIVLKVHFQNIRIFQF